MKKHLIRLRRQKFQHSDLPSPPNPLSTIVVSEKIRRSSRGVAND